MQVFTSRDDKEDNVDTSWVVKGAKVVLLTGHRGDRSAKTITPAFVEKVNKRSFKLHGRDTKYSLDSLREETGSACRVGAEVVRPDDPRIAQTMAEIAVTRGEAALHSAYEAVRREPTRDGLATLVQAAQALDTLLEQAGR